MRIKLFLLIFTLITAGFQPSIAREIIVKEVRLSLFNKPVSGYKFTLDKSSKFITSQITKHVSEAAGKPFQFEKTIIFENVMYAPVTLQKEISLYYLLRPLPGNSTEVTTVAMYDYKNSINSKEYPDLALKLLYDLATMVKKMSGDNLLFEGMILDGSDLEQFAKAAEQRKEQEQENLLVEQFQEEEVEHTEVLIKNDPFQKNALPAKSDNTILGSLNQKIAELNKKEKELMSREVEMKEQLETIEFQKVKIAELQAEANRIRDSLTVTQERLRASVALDMAGDEISVSNIDRKRIEEIEATMEMTERQNKDLQERAESMTAQAATYDRKIVELKASNSRLEEDLRKIRSENALLKADYLIIKSKMTTQPGISESGDVRNQQQKILSSENMALREDVRRLTLEIDEKEKELKAMRQLPIAATTIGDDSVRMKINAMRDSISMLRTSLSDISAGSREAQRLKQAIDDKSIELQSQKDQNNQLKSQVISLTQERNAARTLNGELEEKLKTSLATLKSIESSSGGVLNQIQEYQNNLENLQAELSRVKSELEASSATVQSLTLAADDSMRVARALREQMKTQSEKTRIEQSQTGIAAAKAEEKARKLEIEKGDLQSRVNMLNAQIDSLESGQNKPLSEREKYIYAQNSRLDKLAQDLEAWKAELEDREKLIGQRELIVEEKFSTVKSLEKKYNDIVARENKLKALEQKMKQADGDKTTSIPPTPTVSPSQPVQYGASKIEGGFSKAVVMEIGHEVPVFSFTSTLTYKKTQRQIVAYLLKQGYLYDDKYPNIVYSDVVASGLGFSGLDMRFRLEARGTGTVVRVSFRRENGSYVELNDEDPICVNIKQFLKTMFSFRF